MNEKEKKKRKRREEFPAVLIQSLDKWIIKKNHEQRIIKRWLSYYEKFLSKNEMFQQNLLANFIIKFERILIDWIVGKIIEFVIYTCVGNCSSLSFG